MGDIIVTDKNNQEWKSLQKRAKSQTTKQNLNDRPAAESEQSPPRIQT